MSNTNRQLYPDFLRATSIFKIVIFHFFSWKLLTYIPSLGIMFSLGGLFTAYSLTTKPTLQVLHDRFFRLMPTWWTFVLLIFVAGFFYAQGANIPFNITFAWIIPYQQVTWSLDNPYANDATVVTWYIAAYLWMLVLTPLLLNIYNKLKWIAVLLPVIGMIVVTQFYIPHQTVFKDTLYNLLTFGGCWMLGFTKADKSIEKLPWYVIWGVALVCSIFGIVMTYNDGTLSETPIALSIMSFGIALLLLSFNPNLNKFPIFVNDIIRMFNTFAVTIYLFHNILIDIAFKIGEIFNIYDYGTFVGQTLCFIMLIGLIYVATKTIGKIETYRGQVV